MRRILTLSITLALLTAACGGTDEPSGSTLPGSQNTTPGTQGQGTTSTNPGSSGGVSEGTVTIENETFEFEGNKSPNSCVAPDPAGGASVALHLLGAAGSGSETSEGLELVLAPEGGPYEFLEKIEVNLADGRRWVAHEDQDSGRVDSWSFEGDRVVGTATFFSSHEDRLVPGTFDVFCGDS